MYYTSTNQNDLIAYVERVNVGEQYNGTTTTWANVIKHDSQNLWAVKVHPKYEEELTQEETLGSDWFPQNDIE